MALLLAGCAVVDPGPATRDVQGTISDHTNRKVQWVQGTDEDKQAAAFVARLLQHDLTANAAVQIALLNNKTLQATFEEIGLSQADLVQAGLFKNPNFSGSVRFPTAPPLASDVELAVAQDFLDIFLMPLRKRMAALELERTKLRVGYEALSLAAEVKRAFYTVQAAEQMRKRLELIQDINQTAGALAKQQNEAGTLNDLDTELQTATANESQVQVAESEVEITHDREELTRLLGLSGGQAAWTVAGELPAIPEEKVSLDDLEARFVHQRLDVAAADRKIEALAKALSLKKGTRFLPGGVNVGVDGERNPDGSKVIGPTLDLELPIFDQGQADVGKLEALLRQAQAERDALVVNASSEIREQWKTMTAKAKLAAYYREVLLPQRVRILKLSQQQYNFMLKGAYDLLLAKQQEVDAERLYIESWRDYWTSRADLEKAAGGYLPPQDGEVVAAAAPASTGEK